MFSSTSGAFSSLIRNGGVLREFKISMRVTCTSISPVAMRGFSVPSGRAATTPRIASTNSERTCCVTAMRLRRFLRVKNALPEPDRSRRSTKITPPWSRLVCAQPMSVTSRPISPARSVPHPSVRRQVVVASVIFMLESLFRESGNRPELFCSIAAYAMRAEDFAIRTIFQRTVSCAPVPYRAGDFFARQFIVAQDKREPRALPVGFLHLPFQTPPGIIQQHRNPGSAQLRRQGSPAAARLPPSAPERPGPPLGQRLRLPLTAAAPSPRQSRWPAWAARPVPPPARHSAHRPARYFEPPVRPR